MWPMLNGIGPILGDGAVGSFVAADGNITWFYQDGKTGTRNPAGLETVSLTLDDAPVSTPCPLRSPFWSTAARQAPRKLSPSLSTAGPTPASLGRRPPANPPPSSPSSWMTAPNSTSPPRSTPTAPASLPRWFHARRGIPFHRRHAAGEQRPGGTRCANLVSGEQFACRAAPSPTTLKHKVKHKKVIVIHQGS
jgi:hypothetical protein